MLFLISFTSLTAEDIMGHLHINHDLTAILNDGRSQDTLLHLMRSSIRYFLF